MKKEDLRKMILEELEKIESSETLDEGILDRIKARVAGLKGQLASTASGAAGKALGSLGASTAASELQQASQSRAAGAQKDTVEALMRSHALKIVKSTEALRNAFTDLNADLDTIGGNNPNMVRNIIALKKETIVPMQKLVDFLASGGKMKEAPAPVQPPAAIEAPKPSAPAVSHSEPKPAAKPEPKVEKPEREAKVPSAPKKPIPKEEKPEPKPSKPEPKEDEAPPPRRRASARASNPNRFF